MQIRLCLDEYMKAHNVSRYELAKRTGIQYPVVDRYYKNQVQRYDRYILGKFLYSIIMSDSRYYEVILNPAFQQHKNALLSCTAVFYSI